MQCIPAEHQIGCFALVSIRQEPSLDNLQIWKIMFTGLVSQRRHHGRRHIDGDHRCTKLGGGQSKDTGAGAQVDNSRLLIEAERLKQLDVLGRIELSLGVIRGYVSIIEMLGSSSRHLVQPPTVHASIMPSDPRV